jgi:hypothetical protein
MSAVPITPASRPLEQQQAFMQALTTEHFTLQTARAVAVNEGNGRTALYVGALSSTLVALALVAQRSPLGQLFFVVALTVLPAVFFLGLVTYVRVLQSSVEDIIYARAINRIRHYYTEIDPSQAHHFLLSGRDDVRGALANMHIRDTWTQFLFTMPSAVAVINGLLGGVTVALAVATAAHLALLPTVLAGMVSGTVILALHVAYQVRRFAQMKATVEACFPSQRRQHVTVAAPAWHPPRWRRRRTGSGHADPGGDRRGGAGRAAAVAPAGPGRRRLGGAGAAQP